jgi:hypothetical protein
MSFSFIIFPAAIATTRRKLRKQRSKEGSIKKLNWPYLFHENHSPGNNFTMFDKLRETTFLESGFKHGKHNPFS